MKKVIVIVSVLAIGLLLAAGALVLIRRQEDSWICQNGVWQKHGNPSSPKPAELCPVEGSSVPGLDVNKGDQGRIGGQTDEHGCVTPAGYSWCESKGKCLRSWEEICP